MTRTEAITIIEKTLPTLDDEQARLLADFVQSMPVASAPVRAFSAREHALLERSKADVAVGRTLTHDELVAELDEDLARLGVPKSSE
jgi:hypothetical protein